MDSLVAVVILSLLSCASQIHGRSQSSCCRDYCYVTDNEQIQRLHFATKTPYMAVKGSEPIGKSLFPNCNPKKIWLYSRHGTRLPEAHKIERLKKLEQIRKEVIENYEVRKSKPDIGALCQSDLDLLKNWHWNTNISTNNSEYLTEQGWNELKYMATRLQNAFPNVIENKYNSNQTLFRHTNTQRTEASFEAFIDGLYGRDAIDSIHIPEPPKRDILLRAYDYCDIFKSTKGKNKDEKSEYKKFMKSTIFKEVIYDVSRRLGYILPLGTQQVFDMFEMCRYDQAWDLTRKSPWCMAFTPDQVEVLEYTEYLSKYYRNGYGRPSNVRVQCAAVNDMITHLDSNKNPKTIAYFTHSRSLILLLIALQAAKDTDDLRADNYLEMSRRKFRTSEISPFASNVVAVKMECPYESGSEKDKVMFLLNEKPMDFDWCEKGLCNWSEVKERYKEFTQNDCNKYFCSEEVKSGNRKSSASSRSINLFFIIFASVIAASAIY